MMKNRLVGVKKFGREMMDGKTRGVRKVYCLEQLDLGYWRQLFNNIMFRYLFNHIVQICD